MEYNSIILEDDFNDEIHESIIPLNTQPHQIFLENAVRLKSEVFLW